MIRSSSSSSSVVSRQASSSQAIRTQSIKTSSVRRYQKVKSSTVSTGGWHQQFSVTSMGHRLAAQTDARMSGEVLQKRELGKTTQEDCGKISNKRL